MSDFEKQFGKNLKKLRRAKCLSQEQLAEKLEIGSTTVSKIETGKCFVTSETLEKIIQTLEINPCELFLFDNQDPADFIYKKLLNNLKSDKIRNNFTVLKILFDFTNNYLNK